MRGQFSRWQSVDHAPRIYGGNCNRGREGITRQSRIPRPMRTVRDDRPIAHKARPTGLPSVRAGERREESLRKALVRRSHIFANCRQPPCPRPNQSGRAPFASRASYARRLPHCILGPHRVPSQTHFEQIFRKPAFLGDKYVCGFLNRQSQPANRNPACAPRAEIRARGEF